MKQIVVLLFTLSGIYHAAAQNDVAPGVTSNISNKDTVFAKNNVIKKDSTRLVKLPFVKLLTNPVKDRLEIAVSNFEPGMAQVLIMDTKSHTLRNDSRMIYSSNELITVMFALPAGVYIIVLKQRGRSVSKKFIVAP